MPVTHSSFTPSASATILADTTSTALTLPAPDAGNPVTVVQNLGPGTVSIAQGTLAGALFNVPGSVTIPAGGFEVLTSPGWATTTAASVQSLAPYRATVRVLRGSVADTFTFASSVEVI